MSDTRQIRFNARQVLPAARLNAALDEAMAFNVAPNVGAVTRTVQDKLREAVSVFDFGATGNNITDDTAAIQAAIDYVYNRGGGAVLVPNGSYKIKRQGTHVFGTRGYCLKLRSGVSLEGYAPGGAKLVYNRTSEAVDLLVTDFTGDIDAGLTTNNVSIRNIVVDGDSDTPGAGDGMSLWLFGINGLAIENFTSLDSTNWGVRLQECDGVFLSNLVTQHGPDVNADGIHFVDCRNVSGDASVFTQGDDGVIIETLAHDVWGYNLSVIVEAPVTVAAAGRGILLLHEDIESPAARVMRDISIRGVVSNCKGTAFVTSGALLLSNVDADITARNCESGIALVSGSASVAGRIEGCYFDLVITDSTQNAITVVPQSGSVIRNNRMDALISSPGNGYVAATLRGSFWSGAIQIDYNPRGDKTTFGYGLDMFATDSTIDFTCRGARTNLYVRTGADRNVFRLGRLFDATVADIEIVSGHSSPPVFVGGRLSGAVDNASLGIFVGVVGAPSFNVSQAMTVAGQITGVAVTQSDTDTTAGRLLKVGDYGIGANATAPLLTNMDAATVPGGATYRYDASTTGAKPAGAAAAGWVETLRLDGGTMAQRLTEAATAMRVWRRNYTAGSWGAWQGPI